MRIEATPARRRALPRLTAALALFAISAATFCALAGYELVRQADDRQAIERRVALQGAVATLRQSGLSAASFDAITIRAIERGAGVRDLRFETEPLGEGRELQSVLDRDGRILGWLSFAVERSMRDTLARMEPILLATGLCFVGFAGFAMWQVRRTVRDLSASENLAWSLAYEDALSGLPNRRKMIEDIDAAIAVRAPHEVVSLAFVDLDALAEVNAAHGHHAGDLLLGQWAARLQTELPARAVAARFDGDQFAVLLTGLDATEARGLLCDALQALARPFWIEQQVVQINATVGLACAPADAADRDALTRAADLALRAGKRKVRGGVTAYEAAMDAEFGDRRFIEGALVRALADRALDVHYQPIVTADGARIVAAEALARWRHPERGDIPPTVFIAAAERAGLMGELGEFVLRRALTDAARWPELSIAVNLSPVQVRDRNLVDLVAAVLAETGIPAQRLILEVTEGVLIDDPDTAKTRLDALRELGVRLALDDFGTGYSSLSYLQRFRFDKLKIDRSFVAPISRDDDNRAMIQAIVSLGRALGLSLLAEGVETEEQRVLLRLAGCEELQGYLFARPAPAAALDALMAEERAAANPRVRHRA